MIECLRNTRQTTPTNNNKGEGLMRDPYYWFHAGSGGLRQDQIDHFHELAKGIMPQAAKVFKGNEENRDIRRSEIRWMTHNQWALDTLHWYAKEANRKAFNVDLDKVADIQYTQYFATDEGHYDWHHDIHWNNDAGYDRKLSITICLTDPDDYEGGDFEFNECGSPPRPNPGDVLVFPSYLRHRVTPVTRGTRTSIVAWFEGPRWR